MVMNFQEAELSQSEDKEDDLSKKTTPSLLKYMDRECERARLNSVVTLLLAHEGREVLTNILNLCDKYKLSRLEQLILDSGDAS